MRTFLHDSVLQPGLQLLADGKLTRPRRLGAHRPVVRSIWIADILLRLREGRRRIVQLKLQVCESDRRCQLFPLYPVGR